jgi:hypothetical protein
LKRLNWLWEIVEAVAPVSDRLLRNRRGCHLSYLGNSDELSFVHQVHYTAVL